MGWHGSAWPLVALLLVSGCAQDRPAATAMRPTADPTVSAAPSATPRPTVSATPSPTVSATPSPPPAPTVSPTRSAAPAARRTAVSVPLCPDVPAVQATQVLLVVGSGSAARIRACEKRQGQWVSVRGTMFGHVGRGGVAPVGAKREGDGRTPSGTYRLGLGFGQRVSPGVTFGWRRVDSGNVWVDDPSSSLYNTWQRTPANGRWESAESLDVPAYAYAQVIDYNTARTPGKGSAIFLHVDLGRSTAGCVALPREHLLWVLRWERPGALVVIR